MSGLNPDVMRRSEGDAARERELGDTGRDATNPDADSCGGMVIPTLVEVKTFPNQ